MIKEENAQYYKNIQNHKNLTRKFDQQILSGIRISSP